MLCCAPQVRMWWLLFFLPAHSAQRSEPMFSTITKTILPPDYENNPTQLNYGMAVTDVDGDGDLEIFVAGWEKFRARFCHWCFTYCCNYSTETQQCENYLPLRTVIIILCKFSQVKAKEKQHKWETQNDKVPCDSHGWWKWMWLNGRPLMGTVLQACLNPVKLQWVSYCFTEYRWDKMSMLTKSHLAKTSYSAGIPGRRSSQSLIEDVISFCY